MLALFGFFVCALLSGCGLGLGVDLVSQEEQVRQMKVCTDGGMDYWVGNFGRIICQHPK